MPRLSLSRPSLTRLSLLLALSAAALPRAGAAPARPSPAKPAPAASVNPAPYLRQLGRIGGNLRDFQATLDARMVEPGSKRALTFKLNVAARLPDSVRMDVVQSNNGMFRGWKFARVGPSVRVYDPISERATSMDIAKVTGKQPIRMDLGIDLFAGIFRPNNFTPASARRTTLAGKPAVLLKLLPKPGFNDPKAVLKLTHILLWMDPVKKAPLLQESYGIPPMRRGGSGPMKLLTAKFLSTKPAGPGLWYPDQIQVTRAASPLDEDAPRSIRLRLARVNGTLVPTEVTAVGRGSSSMRYINLRVNAGLPASTFRPGA